MSDTEYDFKKKIKGWLCNSELTPFDGKEKANIPAGQPQR